MHVVFALYAQMPKFTKMAFFIDARWDYSLVADMSKAFLYLRKSYILISRFSSLLPWIILRSSVMSALRYSSNSLKSSSSSSNGHRELSTWLFKSEQFNQEGLTPGSRAQRSIYCSPGRAIWRDHSERMDEAAVRLHQHFRRNRISIVRRGCIVRFLHRKTSMPNSTLRKKGDTLLLKASPLKLPQSFCMIVSHATPSR